MIKCSNENCGFENPDGSKFCCACGAKIDIKHFCPTCGAELIAGAKFCNNCGYNFVKAEETKVAPAQTDMNETAKNVADEQVEQNLPRAKRGLYEYFDIYRGLMPTLSECPLAWEKTDDGEWIVTQKDVFWCREDYGTDGYLGNYKPTAEHGYRMWVAEEEYKGDVRYCYVGNDRYVYTVDKFAYDGDYIDERADIEEKHKGKISGIIDACKSSTIFSLIDNDNIAGAKEYVKRNPSVVSSENPISPLLAAAMTGSVAMAKVFIDAGADVNQLSKGFYGRTALIAAASQGDAVMAKFLLDNGSMAFATCENGDTPLHYAAKSENGVVCLKVLLQIPGIDINLKNNDGHTALDLALTAGTRHCVNFLREDRNYIGNTQQSEFNFGLEEIEKEVKLQKEIEDHRKESTDRLIKILENEATIDGNTEARQFLIEGADPNVQGSWGTSPILRVESDVDMLKLLIEKYADVNAKNKRGQTLLHLTQNVEIAKTLIENGADVNARDDLNATPLHLCKNAEIAKRLIENGADVSAKDNHNNPPLYTCDNEEVAKVLAENIVTKSGFDKNSLPIFVNDAEIPILCALIGRGIDVNTRVSDGKTMLHNCRSVAVLQKLIENGADVNAKDNDGLTPLHCVQTVAVAKKLIESGADVNAKDNNGETPLHRWTYDFDEFEWALLALLKKHGANINARDNRRRTPLHICRGRYIARCLIQAGAELYAKDSNGTLPSGGDCDAGSAISYKRSELEHRSLWQKLFG